MKKYLIHRIDLNGKVKEMKRYAKNKKMAKRWCDFKSRTRFDGTKYVVKGVAK